MYLLTVFLLPFKMKLTLTNKNGLNVFMLLLVKTDPMFQKFDE